MSLAGAKTPRAMRGLLRDQPMVQADIGHAEANIRAGRAFLTEAVRDLWATVSTTGTISLDQRAALRIAATHAIWLAVQVVDTVYNAARGDLDLRGASPAARLPGHSRHQPAHAGAPCPLRAGRPLLAGVRERGGAILEV